MKRNTFHIILTVTFLLSACGGNPAQAQPTVDSVIKDSTSTPSPLPIATQTAIPSETPTVSVTPLPTIPTFTPTFDPRTIVTVTPASPAECPKEDAAIKINFEFPHTEKELPITDDNERLSAMLDFLNRGGRLQLILNELNKSVLKGNNYQYQDVNSDGIKDFLYTDFAHYSKLHIFYCDNGKYNIFTDLGYGIEPGGYIITIRDLNMNGIPEIVAAATDCDGCWDYSVLEWDGIRFSNIAINEETNKIPAIIGKKDFEIKDINNDGTIELVLTGDKPSPCCETGIIPWRYKTVIYSWNGKIFTETYTAFEHPKYRFQAVQDADRETVYGNFSNAALLYQDVIFSSNLEWWSPQRLTYEKELIDTAWFFGPTPFQKPLPLEDISEYPKLAAYAYYRIMLLHTVRGYESDAGTVYNTLQQKFGADPNGRPYVEMATAFWDAYQSTHQMYDGCAAAIQYAAEHPEILIPLGSDYHGAQSHTYVPADVCPFR